MKTLTLLILIAGCTFAVLTQNRPDRPFTINGKTWPNQRAFVESGLRCGTLNESDAEMKKNYENLKKASSRKEAALKQSGMANPLIVPVNVYFHVINRGQGVANGDLTPEMITNQMNVLNQSFSGASGGSGTKFVFNLALVTRTTNDAWYFAAPGSPAERSMKAGLRTGSAADLNIFTTNPPDGLLGWATFPWQAAANLDYDGVVINFASVPGGAAFPYNLGDTATHEVGHWLGLYHTFHAACQKIFHGDLVWDTPMEASPAFGFPTFRDTCVRNAGSDPVTNFMDYSDDACMFKFSRGQAERMDAASSFYRNL